MYYQYLLLENFDDWNKLALWENEQNFIKDIISQYVF